MQTRFILIETSHAGNVGAAARALKVMGFDELVLVAPRWPNVLRKEETIQRASGANDVLAKARVVDTLEQALDGVTHLCATAMTPRDFGPPTRSPREHFAEHVALSIPTHPQFGSLNLGSAIQVIAYDWRLALGGFPVQDAVPPADQADAQQVAGMLSHWEKALTEIGFLDPVAPKKLMPRLNQLFNRADLSPEEIHILRGVAKAMIQAADANKQVKR